MVRRDLVSIRLRLALINRKYLNVRKLKTGFDFFKYRLFGIFRRRLTKKIIPIYEKLLSKNYEDRATERDFEFSKKRVLKLKKKALKTATQLCYLFRVKNLTGVPSFVNKQKKNNKVFFNPRVKERYVQARRFYATDTSYKNNNKY